MFAMTPHGEDGNRCIRYHWRNDQPSSRCKDGDTPAGPAQMPCLQKLDKYEYSTECHGKKVVLSISERYYAVFGMFLSIYLKSHGP